MAQDVLALERVGAGECAVVRDQEQRVIARHDPPRNAHGQRVARESEDRAEELRDLSIIVTSPSRDQQSPTLQGGDDVLAQGLDDVRPRHCSVEVEEQGDGSQTTVTSRPSRGQHAPAVASRRCRIVLAESGVCIRAPERLQRRRGVPSPVQCGGERGQHRIVQLGNGRQHG